MNAPWGGYMLWVQLPDWVYLPEVASAARAAGVVFAGGTAFFALPPGEDRKTSCIRLNCARAAEPDLERGVEILGKIVSGLA